MTDFGKIKKGKSRFGDVPAYVESSRNLEAPENTSSGAVSSGTDRTAPLNFKVTPEFRKAFRQAALDSGLKLVELLEASFKSYKKLDLLHKS